MDSGRTDLIFGSNSELRAICEVYASDDAKGEIHYRFCKSVDQSHES